MKPTTWPGAWDVRAIDAPQRVGPTLFPTVLLPAFALLTKRRQGAPSRAGLTRIMQASRCHIDATAQPSFAIGRPMLSR